MLIEAKKPNSQDGMKQCNPRQTGANGCSVSPNVDDTGCVLIPREGDTCVICVVACGTYKTYIGHPFLQPVRGSHGPINGDIIGYSMVSTSGGNGLGLFHSTSGKLVGAHSYAKHDPTLINPGAPITSTSPGMLSLKPPNLSNACANGYSGSSSAGGSVD